MDSCIHHASCRWVMLLMVLVTFTRPCFAANLLDPGKFSQTLTKLATDGLGTGSLQVTITVNAYVVQMLVVIHRSFLEKPLQPRLTFISVLILGL